ELYVECSVGQRDGEGDHAPCPVPELGHDVHSGLHGGSLDGHVEHPFPWGACPIGGVCHVEVHDVLLVWQREVELHLRSRGLVPSLVGEQGVERGGVYIARYGCVPCDGGPFGVPVARVHGIGRV